MLLFLRLTENFRSPLLLVEIAQQMQQATVAATAWSLPAVRKPGLLFQGWVQQRSFRISRLPQGSGHRQTQVVVEGEATADDTGGSRIQLVYRPTLSELLVLGFWLIFTGTLVLVSFLGWLRTQREYTSWGPTGIFCLVYGVSILSFWWRARQVRRLLINLLSLERVF